MTDELNHTTREELEARAAELDIEGRSRMSKADLAEAVASAEAAATPGASTAEPGPPAPENPPAEPTKADLLEHAAELEIDGRSSMTKDELAAAIAAEEARLAGHRAAGPSGNVDETPAGGDPGNGPTEPTPDDVVGRPPLASLAEERAANREPRVIGAP
jgi:hypothetical protein